MFPFSRMLPPAIALAAALCAVFPAAAERADRDQPMRIDADALRYENVERLSTFTGNVVVTKGTIIMRGEELQVRQDEAGTEYVLIAEEGAAVRRDIRTGYDLRDSVEIVSGCGAGDRVILEPDGVIWLYCDGYRAKC